MCFDLWCALPPERLKTILDSKQVKKLIRGSCILQSGSGSVCVADSQQEHVMEDDGSEESKQNEGCPEGDVKDKERPKHVGTVLKRKKENTLKLKFTATLLSRRPGFVHSLWLWDQQMHKLAEVWSFPVFHYCILMSLMLQLSTVQH